MLYCMAKARLHCTIAVLSCICIVGYITFSNVCLYKCIYIAQYIFTIDRRYFVQYLRVYKMYRVVGSRHITMSI